MREPESVRPTARLHLSLKACILGGAMAIALSIFPVHVFAFRPFTSTDADVVDAKEFEVEFGYLTVERDAGETGYITPSVVLNYGLLDTLELVGEFELEKPADTAWAVADPGVFLKALLKRGVLQDQPGPSVAMEFGVLLPSSKDDEKDVGGEAIVIASGAFAPFIYHINLGGGIDRTGNAFWKWGAIGEVPVTERLTVVGEVTGEDAANTESDHLALVGARFQPTESGIVFDIGVRRGLTSAAADWAVTAGFTIGF